jgi:hypothetical protein
MILIFTTDTIKLREKRAVACFKSPSNKDKEWCFLLHGLLNVFGCLTGNFRQAKK